MYKTCSVYGLGLQVNLPIAGLAGLPAVSNVDVRMSLGALPNDVNVNANSATCDVSAELDENGVPTRTISRLAESGHFRFDYSDGTVIVVDAQGSRVWATWPDSATLEDTATYLLGPILGFVLRLRGITSLHASAIAVEGRAIALVGPSGAGKSSLAAAFAQSGCAVLTDDVAAILELDGCFKIQPAYPRVRLWPASVKALFGSEGALPRIVPNWDKCFLDLNGPGYRFARHPLPLAAVYCLDERSTDPVRPSVASLGHREALMALVANTYASYLIDKRTRAAEFELLSRLAQSVPIRRLRQSDDVSRIGALRELILNDVSHLTPCTH